MEGRALRHRSVDIFPNPGQNIIFLQNDLEKATQASISIYALDGRLLDNYTSPLTPFGVTSA